MLSFEQEVKQYFARESIAFNDNSSEFKLLDFSIPNFILENKDGEEKWRRLDLEVKEKRQKYNTNNWNIISPEQEQYVFIVDELSCRKILGYAPFSGLLVRNNLTNMYYWFSVLDLFLMPKIRVNRPIQKYSTQSMKGKILLDFRNGVECANLNDAFNRIKEHLLNRSVFYTEINECYGAFQGEVISTQGITRVAGHWDTDVSETR